MQVTIDNRVHSSNLLPSLEILYIVAATFVTMRAEIKLEFIHVYTLSLVLPFESVDEIVTYNHANESY